jgi:hypothetical protein
MIVSTTTGLLLYYRGDGDGDGRMSATRDSATATGTVLSRETDCNRGPLTRIISICVEDGVVQ